MADYKINAAGISGFAAHLRPLLTDASTADAWADYYANSWNSNSIESRNHAMKFGGPRGELDTPLYRKELRRPGACLGYKFSAHEISAE